MEKKRRGARREEKHSNEKKNPCEWYPGEPRVGDGGSPRTCASRGCIRTWPTSTPGASPLQSPGFRHNPKSFNPIAKPPCSSSFSPAHPFAALLSRARGIPCATGRPKTNPFFVAGLRPFWYSFALVLGISVISLWENR
jgi:hypothetical protein